MKYLRTFYKESMNCWFWIDVFLDASGNEVEIERDGGYFFD